MRYGFWTKLIASDLVSRRDIFAMMRTTLHWLEYGEIQGTGSEDSAVGESGFTTPEPIADFESEAADLFPNPVADADDS